MVWSSVLLVPAALFLASPGCDAGPSGDAGTDASGDATSDADADGDAEIDADGDAGIDADTEANVDAEADRDEEPDVDVDVERDLSRCGEGDETCESCHGGLSTGGPPPDTQGRTETELITVGAHATHFMGGVRSARVSCTECHRMPVAVLDIGHCDSPMPAEVHFGAVATSGGMYPRWNHSEGVCSMVYCHGATLDGGLSSTPNWTSSDPISCGSCHTQNYHGELFCECHLNVWAGGVIIAPELHINGRIDM